MSEPTTQELNQVPGAFNLPAEATQPLPYGSGLVHRSYVFSCKEGGSERRFLLQQLNTYVFREPVKVMENIRRVLDRLRDSFAAEGIRPDERDIPELLKTREGQDFHVDTAGRYWRVYRFIGNSQVYNEIDSPEIAREGAGMFGRFSRRLSLMDPELLHYTIPGFHDLALRYRQLETAIGEDTAGRKKECQAEISYALGQQGILKRYQELVEKKILPVRVAHNDTKINNVLFDTETGKGLCVIDLDTVMPSTILSDFGDMIRTFTPSCSEEESRIGKVHLRMPVFRALAEGFMAEAGTLLTLEEKQNLVFGGKMIILMQGIRFLTDHLNGDVYYSISRPGQNLSRARNQFRLLESLLEQESTMQEFLQGIP